MLEQLRVAWKQHYILDQELSIDENMVPYKGNATARQYNKSKHHRYVLFY